MVYHTAVIWLMTGALGAGRATLLVEFLALEVWGHDNCIWVLTERRSLTV